MKAITLNYVDCVPFSCLDSFHSFAQSSQLILKCLILEFLKNMSRPSLF